MVSAAISGFLLTAMCNWTGATPLRNGGLLALVLLWLAGRIAMWTAGWLPAGMAAVIDLLFLPVLGIYALRVLIRHNNRRNLVLGAILLLLTLANLLMHAGFLQRNLQWLQWGENMAFNLITLMMAVIAGRITPAFSANWLRAKGGPAERILISPPLDRAVLIATALLVPADFVSGLPVVTGTLALAVAALHAVRLGLWRGWLVAGEPLL
ncbi:NnrS family protein, partial [Arthrospira platensis SPKY1]|nr:NnrS family protein [Arthrospira platensis SPKY1]